LIDDKLLPKWCCRGYAYEQYKMIEHVVKNKSLFVLRTVTLSVKLLRPINNQQLSERLVLLYVRIVTPFSWSELQVRM